MPPFYCILALFLLAAQVKSDDDSQENRIIDLLTSLQADPSSSIVALSQVRDSAFLRLNSSGYSFNGANRKVHADPTISNALAEAMHTHSVYTFVITLQSKKSAGALLTLSRNASRLFEVYYQYRHQIHVRVIYQRQRGDLRTLSFTSDAPQSLSFEIVLTVTPAAVEFMVNCGPPQQVTLDEPISISSSAGDKMVAWVAQRNPTSGLFTGTISRMLLITNRIQSSLFFPSCSAKEYNYNAQVSRAANDSAAASLTIETVQALIEAAQSALQARVLDLECRLRDVENQLVRAEARLRNVQSCANNQQSECQLLTTVFHNETLPQSQVCTQCSCQLDGRTGARARVCRSLPCDQMPVLQCSARERPLPQPLPELLPNSPSACEHNGTLYENGSVWITDCDSCSCHNGRTICKPMNCPVINCSFAQRSPGECCPKCFRACSVDERTYEHGESIPTNGCETCRCNDGEMHCASNASCPALNCSLEDQYTPDGSCCPSCFDRERCIETCGPHYGNCSILPDGQVTCACAKGYELVYGKCTDIDECKRLRRACPKDSRCRNTDGSYTCTCRNPGFTLNANKTACVDIDECQLGTHRCPATAFCNNTVGTYSCTCKPGYVDVAHNGHNCEPECDPPCGNGGTCVRPNVCQCPFGFHGPTCDQDIDECAWNLHSCSNSSFCVNVPGTYYCSCIEPAYHLPPSFTDSKFGQNCVDVDECEIASLNTCPEDSHCVNTVGGYDCECNDETSNCSLSCLMRGEEYGDGQVFRNPDSSKTCEQCECRSGRVFCAKKICNCNEPSSQSDVCCEHCRDANMPCRNGSKIYQHGDKWTSGCTQYHCESGRIYAMDVNCPDVQCSEGTFSVRRDGHCCSICEERDVCSGTADLALFNVTTTCKAGATVYSHAQRWSISSPHCLSCECKHGHICCTQDPSCIE